MLRYIRSKKTMPILLSGHIKLEAGVYVLPVNFSMDYRDTDITIEGGGR